MTFKRNACSNNPIYSCALYFVIPVFQLSIYQKVVVDYFLDNIAYCLRKWGVQGRRQGFPNAKFLELIEKTQVNIRDSMVQRSNIAKNKQ